MLRSYDAKPGPQFFFCCEQLEQTDAPLASL